VITQLFGDPHFVLLSDNKLTNASFESKENSPMKQISKQGSSGMVDQASELEERVRRRAYEFYEERGRTDGHDMDDWLRAESEITSGRQEAVAA
jgi:hypothetical protein